MEEEVEEARLKRVFDPSPAVVWSVNATSPAGGRGSLSGLGVALEGGRERVSPLLIKRVLSAA
jgi:hypothetical protein